MVRRPGPPDLMPHAFHLLPPAACPLHPLYSQHTEVVHCQARLSDTAAAIAAAAAA
jgi:hypothetical protein